MSSRCQGLPNCHCGPDSCIRGRVISHREPNDRNRKNGFTATSEYRADGRSNCDVRSNTTPGSPDNVCTSDSGVCAVGIS